MHLQLKAFVKVYNWLTFFHWYIGTRQRCVSYLIFFAVFINDINRSYLRCECNKGVFVTDEIVDIFALMFADDIVSI